MNNRIQTIKQKLFTNWHLVRIVRLAIGIWMLVIAIQTWDWIVGCFSTFFLYQAVTDTGCCGALGCYTPQTRNQRNTIDETQNIEYEEVK